MGTDVYPEPLVYGCVDGTTGCSEDCFPGYQTVGHEGLVGSHLQVSLGILAPGSESRRPYLCRPKLRPELRGMDGREGAGAGR